MLTPAGQGLTLRVGAASQPQIFKRVSDMTLQTKILTYAEYLNEPEVMARFDIIDGEVIMSASPSFTHQMILANLHLLVHYFVNERQSGWVLFAPMDVIVQEEPLRVRQPDLLFVSNENRSIIGRHIHGGPDLVVEVLSPSNSRRDIESKLADYAQIGVLESWIVSPEGRTVEVLTLKDGSWERSSLHGLGDAVESTVLAGVTIPVSEIFTGI